MSEGPAVSALREGPVISALRARVCNPPLAVPHATAGGLVASFPMVLVDLRCNDGVVGSAYVFTYSMLFAPAVARLLHELAPLCVGQASAPAHLRALLHKRFRLIGPQGFTMIAAAAIDMAAWDAEARRAGQPLYRLLGAERRGTPAYGPVGMSGAEGAVREAAAGVALGFRALKAKAGYADAAEDAAVVRALRAAVGEPGTVMVDYNQSLAKAEAIRRGGLLEPERLGWIEEPVAAEDYAGLARVKDAIGTPVQAGENWWGPVEFDKAIAAGATDLLMPDVMKVGGISGWLEVAALAARAGLPVSSHLFPEVSAQLLCATPTAHWLEWTDWSNPVMRTPVELRDGACWPSEAPGIGIEWDEAAVARFEVQV
jgi:mandelate racemase